MTPTEPTPETGTTVVDDDSVDFVLNGTAVSVGRRHPHLLDALRSGLDVTSPKDGCSPTGQCGCCTVLVDGKALVSCQVSLDKVAGRSVTTLEGLTEATRARYAEVFAATGALQCGFCTPGIVMRAHALVEKKGSGLTRESAARLMGGHLCRCTGYTKVLDAVEVLAAGTPVEVVRPGGVGSRGVKYEAEELSLGDRGYVDDLRVPGMVHAALRLTDHTRAGIRSIDTTAAESMSGVVAVLTAADVPGELRVGLINKDWPVLIPVGGRTSYSGDVLAVIVAEDRETARRAAALVDVGYDVLRPIVNPEQAIDDSEAAVWGTDDNVLSRSVYARGDVEAALAASTHVVDEHFETQRIEHAFLEPEATLAVPLDAVDGTGRRLHVYSGGQGVWDDRDQIASVLGVDPQRITVELVSNGGAFGGKEDMANQAQTALAAWLLERPVSCTLSREESLLMHPKRHPIRMHYRAGCDAEGNLTALWARMVGDSGAYASVGMKVLERAAGHASGPYRLPTIDVEAIAARTNNPVCGAFRGFGANQAQFAMEGVMDRLAERVGISGWEMRRRNVIRPGDEWGPGQVMDDGCDGALACLEAVREDVEAATAAGKAVGVGLGLKNSGLGNGFKEVIRAVVHFHDDGTVDVRHCWTEMGQGVHTIAAQVAVEELGVDPEVVRVLVDTSRELGAGQTTGSRGTLMGAGAIADACRAALTDGCRTGVDYEGTYRVDWTDKIGTVDHPVIHSAFGYAAQVVVIEPSAGVIERVIAAHDVGRAVNPLLCEGQIEGSVHMGLGYACTEDFPADDVGMPTNMTLRSLDIIRPKDMPPIDVRLVEVPQPRSPYGIKGVGEIGLVPTAGAVAAALHALDGGWRTKLPMGLPRTRLVIGTGEATGADGLGMLAPNQTPGLVCAHHHLYSVLARGMPAPPTTPSDFVGILEQVWWRLDRALDLEIIAAAARLGALEALEAGCTAIVDHHESPNAIDGSLSVIADACAEVGVRVMTAYGVTDRHGPDGRDAGLAECARFIADGGRGMVGLHAAFTCETDTIAAAAELARSLGVGVHVHVCEDLVDADAVERLAGHTTDDWILVHCVHLPTDHGLTGTIVHNPRSNMNNAVGYAHPTRFTNPVALGSDGIGASMVDEFRVAFARLRESDVTASPDTAWGWLEAGWSLMPEARDDVVTWSYPEMDAWHLAYTTDVRPLSVVIDGAEVLADGVVTRVDADQVRAHAAEAASRLFERL